MYSLLAYGLNAAAGAALVQIAALSDPAFVSQNSNWIFYEPYDLCAIYAQGASLTAAQLSASSWNVLNTPQVYPVNLGLVPPSNPQIVDLRQFPVGIPQNEQVQFQASNNLSTGNEWEFGLMFISPRGQSRVLPTPSPTVGNAGRVRAVFTITTALTAGVWTADNIVTVTQLPKGGTYCVSGLYLIAAHSVAYRCNFPRAPLFQGRKLYPGGLVENAYGNVPLRYLDQWMGPLGYFDTTENFQIALLGSTTEASATYTGYLDLIYMGQQLLGQGNMTPS